MVLFGALAVEGGLVAGELAAQPRDGVVRGGQLRGSGGEGGVVPLLVLLARAGSIRAGLPARGHGGVALGAGGGDRLVRFSDPGCGGLAFAGQRAGGVTGELLGVLTCGSLSFHRGDGLRGGGAGLGGVELGSVPGDGLGGSLGAGLLQLGGCPGADGLGLRFGGLELTGRGQLAAEDRELVQRGRQLRARPAHRCERAVAPDGTVSVNFYDRRQACPAAETAQAAKAGLALDAVNPNYAGSLPPFGVANYCVNASIQFYAPDLTPIGHNFRLSQHTFDPQLNAPHQVGFLGGLKTSPKAHRAWKTAWPPSKMVIGVWLFQRWAARDV